MCELPPFSGMREFGGDPSLSVLVIQSVIPVYIIVIQYKVNVHL